MMNEVSLLNSSNTLNSIPLSPSRKNPGWLTDCDAITGYENTGCAQSMYANRLSFFYDFHGPSMNIDTACSSSLVALVQACQGRNSMSRRKPGLKTGSGNRAQNRYSTQIF